MKLFSVLSFVGALMLLSGFVPPAQAEDFLTLISAGTGYDAPWTAPDVPQLNEGCSGGETAIGKIGCIFTAVVRFLLFVAGVGATVMIVIAGVRLIISTGDDTQVTAAKNTVLYAVIGLLAVMLSYFIVNAILVRVFGF